MSSDVGTAFRQAAVRQTEAGHSNWARMAAVLSACGPPSMSPDNSAGIKDLQDNIETLNKRVASLSSQLKRGNDRISSLEISRTVLENMYQSVELDPAQHEYGRLDANAGTFAVALEDAQQFADGVKVRVDIGNLSAATFAGAKLHLTYGPRPPSTDDLDYVSKYADWQSTLQSKDEELTQKLFPGHWNPVSVVLPHIDSKAFGHLEVKITTNQVLMSR